MPNMINRAIMESHMFDVQSLRRHFPALHQKRDGRTPIFLDGPGGTQVPRRVIDAMVHYLETCNANHAGGFATSQESDQILHNAHAALADLLNAPSVDEVIFGGNMTTLTFQLSRALSRSWKPGEEIMVSRLDHDANVSPWVLAARDVGATVHFIDIHPEDCTLDLDDFRQKLGQRTRLVAVGCASNATGTVSDVKTITKLAHDAGALVFLDAVHFAPHGPIDVQAWDCDFLACSVYKFFGPHVGVLWGKHRLLEELTPYKVRPAAECLPDRWMTGTQNHEGIAGAGAAIEYLADVGRQFGPPQAEFPGLSGRRLAVHRGMHAIRAYELEQGQRLLTGLAQRPRFRVWGITDAKRLSERVPTVAITMPGKSAGVVADFLAAKQIYVWHGNMYALELTERLGLESTGGIVRLGLVHYNTIEEVDQVLEALDEL